MKKIFCESETNKLDSVTEEVTKKTKSELANIDAKNAKVLANKTIFIGAEATKEIKALGLSHSSIQLGWFYDKVKAFHTTAVQYLLKYFKGALTSPVMDLFSALSPLKQSHVLTNKKLKSLATNYSKVINGLDAVNGMNKIVSEIDAYKLDEDIKAFDVSLKYEEFWRKVGELSDGDWDRYEILPYFAIAVGVKFISNSEVERSFSLMNNIHSNKQRNMLSQHSLNSCLHIKSKVESKENVLSCNRCKVQFKSDHCHCSFVEINKQLRDYCSKSSSKYEEYQKVFAETKADFSDELKKKREVIQKELIEKIEKSKSRLANSSRFCASNLFEPVYPKEVKKKTNDSVNATADTGAKSVKPTSAETKSVKPTAGTSSLKPTAGTSSVKLTDTGNKSKRKADPIQVAMRPCKSSKMSIKPK